MREWFVRNVVPEKRTELVPAVTFWQVKNQQVIWAIGEVLQNLFVVPLVSGDGGVFVAFGTTGALTLDTA